MEEVECEECGQTLPAGTEMAEYCHHIKTKHPYVPRGIRRTLFTLCEEDEEDEEDGEDKELDEEDGEDKELDEEDGDEEGTEEEDTKLVDAGKNMNRENEQGEEDG